VSESPVCPRCGATDMVLKTARKGGNAGSQFWSCARFPTCRGTRDFAALGVSDPTTTPVLDPAEDIRALLKLPIEMAAAPRMRFGQRIFFQAAGMPAMLVEALHVADVDRSLVRAAAQWRLDFPASSVDVELTSDERVVLSVAESILTRGATPFCSPSLEGKLADLFAGLEDPNLLAAALRRVAMAPTADFKPTWAESAEESSLVEWSLRLIHADRLPWVLVPQVELAALAPTIDPGRGLRGDVLFVHPENDPILVEVDGTGHLGHEERDEERDSALEQAGVRIVRIMASEARAGTGSGLDALARSLRSGAGPQLAETEASKALRWCKLLHQIQLALLVAIKGGWLSMYGRWRVGVVLPATLADGARADTLVALAATDLRELLSRLADLYGHPRPSIGPDITYSIVVRSADDANDLDLLIGPGDGTVENIGVPGGLPFFLISDVAFPRELRAPLTASAPTRIRAPSRDDARWFLRYLFRKDDFWEGQWEAVGRSLRGEDSVVLLPTGAGKSIAFQLSALLLPGRCVVVDPILSLIEDQIDNLRRVGIDRALGITSMQGAAERDASLRAFRTGHFLFCYIAPERFQTTAFRDALRALTVSTPISLVAIDEAHCVSEWGHDFRTAYLGLGRVARAYGASQGAVPPLTALTGTASKIVLKDVQRELGITSFDAIITPKSFDRRELHFRVVECKSDEKGARVIGLLQSLPTRFSAPDATGFFRPNGRHTNAGLVFCPHTNGSFGVLEFAKRLSNDLGAQVEVYSGKSPHKGMSRKDWDRRKQRIAHDFKRNKVSLLACTSAFGMGVDIQNVRYTVHIGLPQSIESFYQEAGRAGRDRRRSENALVLSHDLGERSSRLLAPGIPLSDVARIVQSAKWDERDDVLRALWFHVTAFRGEEQEIKDLQLLLDQLGDPGQAGRRRLSWESPVWRNDCDDIQGRERAEKALHRLLVMGVVADYTIDYSSREFDVEVTGASRDTIAASLGRYAAGYQRRLGERVQIEVLALPERDHRAFVLAAGAVLIAFVYANVELARRRAMDEMLQAARVGLHDGEQLRQRVLDYLQHSEWDARLEEVRTSAGAGTEADVLVPILDELVSPNDAASLRGAVGRMLTAYPDLPGLLLLRALSEVLASDGDLTVARNNVSAALAFAREKFGIAPSELGAGVALVIRRAGDRHGAAECLLEAVLSAPIADRALVRELTRRLGPDLADPSIGWLLKSLAVQSAALIEKKESVAI
jgi:ATP-dependent DNA helicase RecQ